MKGRIVVIGASLNGLAFLQELVGALPPDFPAAVFIVQHVAPHTPSLLPRILSNAGPLVAVHPGDCEQIVPGRIYVAPSDRHMLIRSGMIRIAHGPKENFVRPAVDPLFRSAALHYGEAVVGVILTGQLDDGTAGAMAIKENGGTVIVQQPSEATAPSMPLSALRNVHVDHCAPVKAVAELLIEYADDVAARTRLSAEAERLESQADQIRGWLRATPRQAGTERSLVVA